MKKEMKATLIAAILAFGIISGTAIAQTENNTTMPQQMMRNNMMAGQQGMMGGNMMGTGGQGMMGGNMMGMGGMGMMGGNMGHHGMMNQGRPGCMKMMGQGMGMMGGGMMTNMTAENQQKFMDDTRETRKKMHDMRFEYMEAMRNPKTSLGEIADMEQKMLDVRKDVLKKAEKYQSK